MIEPTDITAMLKRVSAGEKGATDRLVEALYEELRRIARGKLRHAPPGEELTPTAIVHEAFMKLFREEQPEWENRKHFFFAASRAMRDVVTRHARIRASMKRGGGVRHVASCEPQDPVQREAVALLELDEELSRLAIEDKLAAQVVELKFFGGLPHEQIARLLDISVSQASREWKYAKARLRERLADSRGEVGV